MVFEKLNDVFYKFFPKNILLPTNIPPRLKKEEVYRAVGVVYIQGKNIYNLQKKASNRWRKEDNYQSLDHIKISSIEGEPGNYNTVAVGMRKEKLNPGPAHDSFGELEFILS